MTALQLAALLTHAALQRGDYPVRFMDDCEAVAPMNILFHENGIKEDGQPVFEIAGWTPGHEHPAYDRYQYPLIVTLRAGA